MKAVFPTGFVCCFDRLRDDTDLFRGVGDLGPWLTLGSVTGNDELKICCSSISYLLGVYKW